MLDSDTANLWQGVGEWEGTFGAPTSVAVDQSEGDDFGSLKVVASAAGHAIGYDATNRLPVAATTPLSFAYMVQVPVTGDYLFRAREWNAVDVVQNNHDDTIGLTAGVWYQYTKSYTTRADAVTVDFQIRDINSLISATEITRIKNVVVRQDADTTFVPSLRIVGDLDLRARVAMDVWTPAATEYLFDKSTGNDGFLFLVLTSGALYAQYGDGSAIRANSTPALGLTGDAHDLRVTMDVGSGAVEWYVDGDNDYSDTMDVGAGTYDSGGMSVGATQVGGSALAGDCYYAEIRDGIDGPVVARMDAGDTAKATL